MPTTQQDIAKTLKVSRSLVGQVLSGQPGNFVSHETKQHILRTAREMNYHPNASARMLRTGKSQAVGMFSAGNMSGLSVKICAEILSSAKYELKVKVFPDREELLAGLTEAARGGLCDAFFVAGDQAEEQGQLLEKIGTPFAAYGRFEDTHPQWHQVDYDHEAMMAKAVQCLADRGRSRPVMACYAADQGYIKHLISGFKEACATRLGLAVDDDMIMRIPVDATTERVIAETVDRWLSLPESIRPDSLVMGAEFFAPQCIEEQLWRNGKRIGFGPHEFAVCGACHPPYGWLVGDYVAFDSLECLEVAQQITESIVLPLLQGKPIERTIIRIVPEMHELSGMSSNALRHLAAIAAQS